MGSRRPERHGELGGVLISIQRPFGRALYRSGAGRASFRPALLQGVVYSQRHPKRLKRASRASPVGLGEGFASPGLVPKRSEGHLRTVFCLGRHCAYHPRFITPCKDTSSTPSRAGAPASGARRVVRAPVGDAAAPLR